MACATNWQKLPVEQAARALVGMQLVLGEVVLRITETEAYGDETDSASHARFGPTSRNEPMFGPPAHAYIYLCYGIHQMLNVVCEEEGLAAATLIRSAEVIQGHALVEERRQQAMSSIILAGPGKVGQALAIDGSWNNHPLLEPGGLEILPGPAPQKMARGPRVGIDYAAPHDRDRPWRFADANSAAVTHKKKLT